MDSKVDARGITVSYTYDGLNRVTERAYAAPSPTPANYAVTPTVNYYYDNLANAKGKLVKVSSSVSTTEYTDFDILGRVTGHKQTTDGEDYTTSYTYNLSGALIEETYPSGRVVKNVLDANGDLSIVESKKNAASGYWHYADTFSYNAAGAVTSMQLGNGRWESTVFNSRLQPTQIGLGVTAGATGILKLDYSYGTTANNGNVLGQTITVKRSGLSDLVFDQTYTYDSLNRLKTATEMTGETENWKQTFLFDRYGNRNFDTTTGATTTLPESFDPDIFNPTFNIANNRMASEQGWSYDAAGNVIGDPTGKAFTYDGENKQVEVEDAYSSTIGEYYFDGDGKRVKKVVPSTGEVTVFVYDASGKMIAEYSTNIADVQDAKVQYLTNDNLGSPRIKTDASGTISSRTDYMPYGEEIIALGGRSSDDDYVADDIRQGFTGYEQDEETGLDFAQARMYAKNIGRFTAVDPLLSSGRIEKPQTWNRYAYVLNNPLLFIDPLGLYEWAESAGGTSSDEDLLEKSKNKKLDKSVRKLAKRQYDFRKEFKAGLDAAKAAASDRRLTPDQRAEAQRAVSSYGDYKKEDNVSVGIVATRNGTPNVAFGAIDGKIHVDLNFNLSQRNSTITIAHEGSHLADFQELVNARGTTNESSKDVDGYSTERRAYFVSSYLAQALDVSPYYPEANKENQVWNKGWSPNEREVKRANGVDKYNGWAKDNRGQKISTNINSRY